MYKHFFKRLIDFFLALFAIVFLSPILILSAILIKLTSSGPIFFLQKRLGKNGEVFNILKFRTMVDKERELTKQVYGNTEGITKIGNILRRFKIDELPQLFNILNGDMAVIGPRPALPEQVNNFNEDGVHRLKVRPGLSGLAQINGNIYLSWEERWKYDRQYVENVSFLLDVKIIFKTLFVIILGEKNFLNKNA